MPLPVLFAAMLAGPASALPPIVVTSHRWAPFISPMGEPFRAHSQDDDTLADWFYQADRNRDGVLTVDEMIADADRFFAKLDTDHDGDIDPDELAHYEYEVAPDIQVMAKAERRPGDPAPAVVGDSDSSDSGDKPRRDRKHDRRDEDFASLGIGGGLQGAARYSLLNIPEPVAAADTDFNRGVTREEFRQAAIARFQLLDAAHQGRVTLAELEARLPAPPTKGRRPKLDAKAIDTRVGNPLPSGP